MTRKAARAGRRTALALALLAAPTAGTRAAPVDDGPFAALRARLLETTRRGDAVSVAIAVARGTRVLWAEGFGWADRERGVRATPDTLYPLGSVSKAITATGVMILAERGRLGLDDPVAPLLPRIALREGAGRAADLKVRHLLNMTGGIPHLWSYVEGDGDGRDASGELLRRYGFVASPPGTIFSYSNLSYGALEHVIASAAREDYAAFMRRAVFSPLGMERTSVGRPAGPSGRIAAAYFGQGRLAPAYRFEPRAAAGLHSSARELLAFAGLHLKTRARGPAILKPASLDLLHTPTLPAGSSGSWYMAGWGVLHLPHGPTLLLANGAILGAAASVLLVPERGLAVVCLTNSTTGEDFTDGLAVAAADALAPGLKARFQTFLADWATRFGPQPYRAGSRFLGVWRGAVECAERVTPVSWTFATDGRILVRFEGGLEAEVTDARLEGEGLTGRLPGSLPLPEAIGRAQHLEFALRPQADMLVGTVRTVSDDAGPGFGLPAFVRLTRVNVGGE